MDEVHGVSMLVESNSSRDNRVESVLF
jgi:hypothetical protein